LKYAAPTTRPKQDNDFRAWALDELRHITDAFSEVETDAARLKEWSVELNKISDGVIIFADGNNFDPGLGRGYYGRHGGAWHKLDLLQKILGAPGALIFTGADAALLNFHSLAAQPGALILQGVAAHLFQSTPIWNLDNQCWDDDSSIWDNAISAQPGALLFTGAAATLFQSTRFWDSDNQEWDNDTSIWNDLLSVQPGALLFTGADAALLQAHIMVATPGSLQLSGAAAATVTALVGSPGALTLTGAEAQFVTTSPFWDDDGNTWNSDTTNWDD